MEKRGAPPQSCPGGASEARPASRKDEGQGKVPSLGSGVPTGRDGRRDPAAFRDQKGGDTHGRRPERPRGTPVEPPWARERRKQGGEARGRRGREASGHSNAGGTARLQAGYTRTLHGLEPPTQSGARVPRTPTGPHGPHVSRLSPAGNPRCFGSSSVCHRRLINPKETRLVPKPLKGQNTSHLKHRQRPVGARTTAVCRPCHPSALGLAGKVPTAHGTRASAAPTRPPPYRVLGLRGHCRRAPGYRRGSGWGAHSGPQARRRRDEGQRGPATTVRQSGAGQAPHPCPRTAHPPRRGEEPGLPCRGYSSRLRLELRPVPKRALTTRPARENAQREPNTDNSPGPASAPRPLLSPEYDP